MECFSTEASIVESCASIEASIFFRNFHPEFIVLCKYAHKYRQSADHCYLKHTRLYSPNSGITDADCQVFNNNQVHKIMLLLSCMQNGIQNTLKLTFTFLLFNMQCKQFTICHMTIILFIYKGREPTNYIIMLFYLNIIFTGKKSKNCTSCNVVNKVDLSTKLKDRQYYGLNLIYCICSLSLCIILIRGRQDAITYNAWCANRFMYSVLYIRLHFYKLHQLSADLFTYFKKDWGIPAICVCVSTYRQFYSFNLLFIC